MPNGRWPRLSLSWLMMSILGISPLFLATAYARFGSGEAKGRCLQPTDSDPLLTLTWLCLPPLAYCCVFSWSRMTWKRDGGADVLGGVRRGALFGLVFLLLSFGPSGLPKIAASFSEFWTMSFSGPGRNLPHSLPTMIAYSAGEFLYEPMLVLGTMALCYATLGAASGGVVAVIRCAQQRRRVASGHRSDEAATSDLLRTDVA